MVPELLLLLFSGVSAAPMDSNDDKSHVNEPWETTGLFEGDIMEPPGTLLYRNAMRNTRFRWPGAVVPYTITRHFNNEDRAIIRKAMEEIERNSCVKFRQRWFFDFNYVVIGDNRNKPGCWSWVGKWGGAQPLNLSRAKHCVDFKVAVHELMHTLGIHHQQSASNRDNYVEIIWENIIPGMEFNFYKFNDALTTNFGIPYDYNSVMHYEPNVFSVNRKATIVPRLKGARIFNDGHLSKGDIKKLQMMYTCKRRFK